MLGSLLAPQLVRYGRGVFDHVAETVKAYGSKVLLVTDPAMVRIGVADRCVRMLESARLTVAVYSDIRSEPELAHVAQGLDTVRRERCDVIVAVGGGSCIDTAKAVAAMATNEGTIGDYRGNARFQFPPLPLVAVPTTAGTGSEVSKVTVITDPVNEVKMMISQPELLPRAALVDPLLTLSCPPSVTAATGVDALCHAIEAYLSRKSHPLTDALALGAVKLIAENIESAYKDGSDIEAREKMAAGSMMAGIAFSNASVTLVHGMSRPIGALFHVPHGISNAMLLPAVMEFTKPQAVQRLADIGLQLRPELGGKSTEAKADAAVAELKRLCRSLGIPNLNGWGIDRDRFWSLLSKMASDAIASGSPGNNPRVPEHREIMELYRVCFDYDTSEA
jgi:alcohol dehydrogenase class IV